MSRAFAIGFGDELRKLAGAPASPTQAAQARSNEITVRGAPTRQAVPRTDAISGTQRTSFPAPGASASRQTFNSTMKRLPAAPPARPAPAATKPSVSAAQARADRFRNIPMTGAIGPLSARGGAGPRLADSPLHRAIARQRQRELDAKAGESKWRLEQWKQRPPAAPEKPAPEAAPKKRGGGALKTSPVQAPPGKKGPGEKGSGKIPLTLNQRMGEFVGNAARLVRGQQERFRTNRQVATEPPKQTPGKPYVAGGTRLSPRGTEKREWERRQKREPISFETAPKYSKAEQELNAARVRAMNETEPVARGVYRIPDRDGTQQKRYQSAREQASRKEIGVRYERSEDAQLRERQGRTHKSPEAAHAAIAKERRREKSRAYFDQRKAERDRISAQIRANMAGNQKK